jgi:hypothetical protein
MFFGVRSFFFIRRIMQHCARQDCSLLNSKTSFCFLAQAAG